ncbi:MAG TPA: metalloregulator ArsR/SmtB family transcription factor [bacterium]|jgi:DNA-binding transcriptional ArsR family regulator
MKIIDLTTKTQPIHVQLDPSPVYDLLAAMYLVENWTSEREFEIDRRWVARARAALGPALRKDLRLFGKERGFLMGLTSLLERRPGISVSEFLTELAATPPADVLERMLTSPRAARQAVPLVREALRRPSESTVTAAVTAYPPEFDGARIRAILSMGAHAAHGRIIALVRAFYERVYRAQEAEVLPVLRAEVEAKRALAAVVSPLELVERASGGFTISPDSEITHVILAPAVHFRPYNLLSEFPGARVFIYPVTADAGDPAAAAQELTRFFKALGDATRLRIVQLLSDREMYLQEIANRAGVTHVTAIHHLALLRAAHVVRVVERQNKSYYQLRPEVGGEINARLDDLFRRPPAGAVTPGTARSDAGMV